MLLEKLEKLLDIVKKAGDYALKEKNNGNLKIETKSDGSYVTNIDKELDKLIVETIKKEIDDKNPIISEEAVEEGHIINVPPHTSFWCIDPIDGTKSYINNNPYYCVNVAFLENGMPSVGLIYAPETKTLWYGIVGYGAFKEVNNGQKEQIFARSIPQNNAILMSSEEQKTSLDFLQKYNIGEEIKLPSAIKFTYIAEGKADFYVRKRNIARDWDIACAHALILAAGGNFEITDPQDFRYGIPPYLAPSLLASGKK